MDHGKQTLTQKD